jgi:hypothetical protein
MRLGSVSYMKLTSKLVTVLGLRRPNPKNDRNNFVHTFQEPNSIKDLKL